MANSPGGSFQWAWLAFGMLALSEATCEAAVDGRETEPWTEVTGSLG
jgi:hypothetical protein